MKTKSKKPKKPKSSSTQCPCGTGRSYGTCCQPFHLGQSNPEQPEQLVRARFAAFSLGMPEFIFRTLHSAHDDYASGEATFVARFNNATGSARYRNLQILDHAPADEHGSAQVLFSAEINQLNQDRSFVEQSTFVQEDGQWRYLMGTAEPRKKLTHALSDMRLDHWQCDHHHHH